MQKSPITRPWHRLTRSGWIGAFGVLLGGAGLAGDGSPADRAVDFQRDVRPILSDKCFQCHGPDQAARQARLRLDRREDAARVLEAGDGLAELVRRTSSSNPDQRMPPADSNLRLSEEEIATLRRWVEQGAPYAQHWSFVPLTQPPVPTVTDSDWPRNEIDRFVLARLQAEGLAPAPDADRARWLRRACFDLTGLPPTLEELDAYLLDDSIDAEQRAVEGLLARPEYGERMATDWLDLARYSDTYGYQVDRDRFVWPWRDWVIRAFNDNMPYDEFLTRQLAGDLLPDADADSIQATTFHRLHPMKVEGGSVPEEFRVEAVADRTQTVATAFLGLTMECCRCHDHKYDPLPQRDYYRLYSFFNNIDEPGLYSYFTASVPSPTLELMDAAEQAKVADVEERLAQAEKELQVLRGERHEAFVRWLESRPTEPVPPVAMASLDFEGEPAGANQSVPGRSGKAVKLSGDDGIGTEVGNFPRYQPFTVSLWMQTPDVKDRAVVFHRSRAWTDAGSRGYQLLIEDGRLSFSLIHFWPGNAVRIRTREPIATGTWMHVAVSSDGSSRADGLRILIDGVTQDCEVVRDGLRKNITGGGGDSITIGERFRDRGFTGGLVDEFRVFDRCLSELEVDLLAGGTGLAEVLTTTAEQFDKAQHHALYEHWLATQDEAWRGALAGLQELRRERSQIRDPLREIMVMRELDEPRTTHVLERGSYASPGEPVEPGTPGCLPPMADDLPRNRLGLARWLTQPDHPLTARVIVNRLWQQCFGEGLVRTPENFGSQGEPPTHPELLDWLAADLVAHDWDLKRTLAMLVTSRTYRQGSLASPELLARDPENRLLACHATHQWPAEMLRDQVLAVSGLLVRRQGGPPARPYEVTESFTPMNADSGDGLYRRSLYTFWKRTGPAPAMMVLDAAKRDVCVVRRERTSSPLQALVMTNGPQFVEAARVLGQRLLQEHGEDDAALVHATFRTLTSRIPDDEEERILLSLLRGQREHYATRPDEAVRFLSVGEAAWDASIPPDRLAAATVLASTLMNYDECVVKR